MIVLYIILLAIVQGITEFLPVSSFGHLCFVQNILGVEHGPGGNPLPNRGLGSGREHLQRGGRQLVFL